MSLSDIAEELHCSSAEVSRLINSQLSREAAEMSEDMRESILSLENARLDYYLRQLMPDIDDGDVKAITAAVKITEVRARINRLDEHLATNTQQVLVIGGESMSYIERLKSLSDGS